MEKCELCPRRCKADRVEKLGVCGAADEMMVAKIMLHHWEEPCISGGENGHGSGAVFFSGCSLKCVYCQNKTISRGAVGSEYSPEKLAEEILSLQKEGAYNINFVTPTHYTHKIKETLEILKGKLKIPVVWNTSGYENKEVIESLTSYVDIFLTDFKYFSEKLSAEYSNAPDYKERALEALVAMVKITGSPVIDAETGLMRRGTIVRHLVLPGGRKDSVEVLRLVSGAVGAKNVILSLMAQYTPEFLDEGYSEINRRITTFEYNKVLDEALNLGFDGYFQNRDSATSKYTPDF
ncbi:MAG: radical SAM protein [Ruminococcaceae bacterium]|nr:radical SAM protein [Oscillospiraceae bacterium]